MDNKESRMREILRESEKPKKKRSNSIPLREQNKILSMKEDGESGKKKESNSVPLREQLAMRQ